jgi:hypothetical protein
MSIILPVYQRLARLRNGPADFRLNVKSYGRGQLGSKVYDVIGGYEAFSIIGYTRDYLGAIVPSCMVIVYRAVDDVVLAIGSSDTSGYYRFDNLGNGPFYLVGWSGSTPVLCGTTSSNVLATPAPIPSVGVFSTQFSVGNEVPLSEGGNWLRPAPAVFTNPVQKFGGLAYDGGTASLTNDAVATVSPTRFIPGNRVRAIATLFVGGTIGAGEVELHFNTTFTSTDISLYECDFGAGGIFGVVKWNGPQSDVTFLPHTGGTGNWVGSVPPVSGDQVMAERTISAGVVSVNVYHIPLATGIPSYMWTSTDDGTVHGPIYTTGQPGIGFDNGAGGGGTNGNFAFTDYQCANF